MDLKEYYNDLRKTESDLESKCGQGKRYPDGVIYVTSLFHRERNSTAGRTLSATTRNAARVITDGTHREATEEEIINFLDHQQDELRRNTAAEQKNKRQYIVVVDQNDKTGENAVFGPKGSGVRGRQTPQELGANIRHGVQEPASSEA